MWLILTFVMVTCWAVISLYSWYRELCPTESEVKKGATSGPTKITTQRRVTPKLLSLVWDGYPLHYDDTHGWGYLVPNMYRLDEAETDIVDDEEELSVFPLK